jgi:hypothetical protein
VTEIASLIGVWLAIVALAISYFQVRDSKAQSVVLGDVAGRLEYVVESMSTRYLGAFPTYLEELPRLVDSANTELLIVAGNPTPAYFSSPELYLSYRQAVERACLRGASVQLVCMSSKYRRRRLELQFPTDSDVWPMWLEKNRSEVEAFLRHRYSEQSIDTLDPSRLLDLLANIQTTLLKEDFAMKGVVTREVDELLPLQLFVSDQKLAIVGFQGATPYAMSHGIETTDSQFVTALRLMCDLYAEGSDPAKH